MFTHSVVWNSTGLIAHKSILLLLQLQDLGVVDVLLLSYIVCKNMRTPTVAILVNFNSWANSASKAS